MQGLKPININQKGFPVELKCKGILIVSILNICFLSISCVGIYNWTQRDFPPSWRRKGKLQNNFKTYRFLNCLSWFWISAEYICAMKSMLDMESCGPVKDKPTEHFLNLARCPQQFLLLLILMNTNLRRAQISAACAVFLLCKYISCLELLNDSM